MRGSFFVPLYSYSVKLLSIGMYGALTALSRRGPLARGLIAQPYV